MEAKRQPNLEQGNVAVLAYNPLMNLIKNLFWGRNCVQNRKKEKNHNHFVDANLK